MKILDHEKKVLAKKKERRVGNNKPANPNSIEARCKREGITLHPSTVRKRMVERGLTFEEAVAYKAVDASECGRRGRKNSRWNMLTPDCKLAIEIAEGKRLKK